MQHEAAAGAALVARPHLASKQFLALTSSGSAEDKLLESVTLFEEVVTELQREYVDEVDPRRLFTTGVNAMLRNQDQLDDLRGKVSTTTDAAKQFYGNARSERRLQQCREYKLQLMIAGAAALFCFVFVLPWFSWLLSGDDGDEGEDALPTPTPVPVE